MLLNIGVDTVRFAAECGYDYIPNAVTGELTPVIRGFESHKLHAGVPVFEFSAQRYYNKYLGYLADPQSFLCHLLDEYNAQFLRIDLASPVRLPSGVDIERLSYLNYWGKRSLQKRSKPWAAFPRRGNARG